MADLIPFDSNDPLEQLNSGVLGREDPFQFFQARSHLLVDTSYFEPTIQTFSEFRSDFQVLPLLAMGTIEELALMANVSLDEDLGVVLVHFGKAEQEKEKIVKLNLFDGAGKLVGNPWYFSDTPVTRALFFNIDPDEYVVVAEYDGGGWLESEVIPVYSQSTSQVWLGRKMLFYHEGE